MKLRPGQNTPQTGIRRRRERDCRDAQAAKAFHTLLRQLVNPKLLSGRQ